MKWGRMFFLLVRKAAIARRLPLRGVMFYL